MIDILNQFYNNNSVLINFISILFGIAGTIIGIITWRDNTRTKKSYQYLFELAEKNIDKSVTEQQLFDKKNEVETFSQRIETLQEQIRKNIPIEAKRTVLKDRLNSQIDLLNQHFESAKRIKDELGKIDKSIEIPPDLLKSIQDEISPEYILKEKKSKAMTELTILTSGAAVSSAILPYPMGKWMSWIMLLLSAPIIMKLIKYSYSRDQIFHSINGFLFVTGLVTLLISIILGIIRMNAQDINVENTNIIILIFFCLSIFSFAGFLWRRNIKIKHIFYKN